MNRILLYWFILFVLVSCASQEKAISSQTSGISTKDYPYISKFHSAVRLKTKGRVEEAIATFEECLTMRQDDDAVYYALSQLEMSRENYQKSAEYTLKAAEIDPNNTWYIQELAYMYFELKDYEKAVENFEKLTQKEPRNVEWQYGYAEALVYTGEKAKAIEALNKTEDQVGVNPELSIQKYNLFMEMNQPDEALRELQQAREKFPRDLQLLGTTVEHYFATGKEQEGIKLLEELVEQDPNNGRAHLALADVYRQQGKQKESFLELKLAFKSHDVDIDTKMKILINFHESMYDLNPELYELVDLMIEIYPNEAKAHSIRGDYLLRAGKDDEALISYSKALEFDKSQYPIWNQVLIMEYQARDYNALYDHSS